MFCVFGRSHSYEGLYVEWLRKAEMNFMARPIKRVIEGRRKEAKAEKLRNIVA